MKKFIIILFLIFICSVGEAQLLKIGFRVEPALLLSEQNNSSSISFTPYGMYLTVLFEPIEKLSFEIRPGYLLGGDNYSGLELGAFAKYMIISNKIFVIAGFNNHSNGASEHNGGGSYEKDILHKGVGFGFQKDSKLSFDVMYYWTDNEDYAYSRFVDNVGNYIRANEKMIGIIKFGFSLAWDVI